MSYEFLMFWHHALSAPHQQVAIASFLTRAYQHGATLYYSRFDVAAGAIAAAAHAVRIPTSAVEEMPSPSGDVRMEPWVWVGSHAATEAGCQRLARVEPAPIAMLCLDSDTMGVPSRGPADHRPFVTGTPWVAETVRHP